MPHELNDWLDAQIAWLDVNGVHQDPLGAFQSYELGRARYPQLRDRPNAGMVYGAGYAHGYLDAYPELRQILLDPQARGRELEA